MPAVGRQRGVSLIEVLMAVLIFSVGLLGVAALMVAAARANHSAYLRTQAVFLADAMADRMSANPVGVWNGFYETPSSYPAMAGTAPNSDCSAGCTPKELAAADLRAWRRQLISLLPNDTWGVIRCYHGSAGFMPTAWIASTPASGASAATAAEPGQLAMRPPYGGTCLLNISWKEREANSEVMTFSRMFQP